MDSIIFKIEAQSREGDHQAQLQQHAWLEGAGGDQAPEGAGADIYQQNPGPPRGPPSLSRPILLCKNVGM